MRCTQTLPFGNLWSFLPSFFPAPCHHPQMQIRAWDKDIGGGMIEVSTGVGRLYLPLSSFHFVGQDSGGKWEEKPQKFGGVWEYESFVFHFPGEVWDHGKPCRESPLLSGVVTTEYEWWSGGLGIEVRKSTSFLLGPSGAWESILKFYSLCVSQNGLGMWCNKQPKISMARNDEVLSLAPAKCPSWKWVCLLHIVLTLCRKDENTTVWQTHRWWQAQGKGDGDFFLVRIGSTWKCHAALMR